MVSLLVATTLLVSQDSGEEITFKGKDITLSGTFTKSNTDAQSPVVLLLPGSGPTDRNGDQPPLLKTGSLKQISDHLTQNGYATFRFDKRPVNKYVTQWPKDQSKISEYFSVENHLADIEAAFNFMKSRPEVDRSKSVILGHSEGGLFTLALAKKLNPQAICLLGTPGRTMDVILDEQITTSINKANMGELGQTLIKENKRILKALKAKPELPKDIPTQLASLYNYSTPHIMHGYINLDPIQAAKNYPGPALIANGEKDIQVSATRDAEPLHNAFKSRKDKTQVLAIIPAASHNFKTVTSETDPGFAGPISTKLLFAITDFLNNNVKK